MQSGRTDQALVNRAELLKLRSQIGFSQSLLQYLGTFSRERNGPAAWWPRLNASVVDRFDLANFGYIIPDPVTQGRGHGRAGWRKAPISSIFGLVWIDADATGPGHWRYIGKAGNPNNPVAINHVPSLRGPKPPDFFQILDYALYQANADDDDTNPANVAAILSLGASLIDQFDTDDLTEATTGSTTTVIEYAGGMAYGMENNDPARPAAAPTPPPSPAATPVVINRRFSSVGEFGYAMKTALAGIPAADFSSSTSPDAPLLDFFSYNPVPSASPRAGVINLNTQNVPVLAAALRGAMQTEATAMPSPTPGVTQQQAIEAAKAIVAETTVRPAVTKAGIARLTEVAAPAIAAATKEQKETITRALSELGQTTTWNLMIDVIAQTGRYTPAAITAGSLAGDGFVVEGEKRYWLHVAIDRATGAVIDQQLEEVLE